VLNFCDAGGKQSYNLLGEARGSIGGKRSNVAICYQKKEEEEEKGKNYFSYRQRHFGEGKKRPWISHKKPGRQRESILLQNVRGEKGGKKGGY